MNDKGIQRIEEKGRLRGGMGKGKIKDSEGLQWVAKEEYGGEKE